MTPVEQVHVERIEHEHTPQRVGLMWWRRVCRRDGQRWPCNRAEHARDIRAGRRDLSGRPTIPHQRTRDAAWWEV